MVTTVDIDQTLLAEAKEALGETTTKATVHQALREVVMRRRQVRALDGLAKIDFDHDAVKIEHAVAQ